MLIKTNCKFVLKAFCILLMQGIFIFADSSTVTYLSSSEADSIIALEESEKKTRLESQLTKLETAEVLSEGKGTLFDGRSIIIREVVPPIPAASSANEPVLSLAPGPSVISQDEEALKTYESLMFSAIVYDREVTRLSWKYEEEDFVAYTNANFNYLQGIMDVSTETSHFNYFMAISGASRLQNLYPQENIPALSAFATEHSSYILQQGDPENASATAGLEALLAHYDANLDALKVKHQRNKALKDARERYDAQNPEEPEDFIMQFWVPEEEPTE